MVEGGEYRGERGEELWRSLVQGWKWRGFEIKAGLVEGEEHRFHLPHCLGT